MNASNGRLLTAILAGALLLRLALIPVTHAVDYTSDEKEYVRIATGLLEGRGFVDSNGNRAVRAPLYPAILSQVARLPAWTWVAHLAGALLGTLAVYLGYRVALYVVPDDRSALAGTLLLAVHPGLAIYAGLLQTETFYTVLLLSLLLVVFRFHQDPGLTRGVMAGILGGLAALTRPVALGFFPLLLLLVLWTGRKEARRLLLPLGVAVLFFALTIAPWAVRNYNLFGTAVPVSSGGGGSLLLGNNPYASGGLRVGEDFESWREARIGVRRNAPVNEVDRSAAEARLALEHMTGDPAGTLLLMLKKSQMFWIYPAVQTDTDLRFQLPAVGVDLFLMLCAAAGLVLLRPPRTVTVPVAAALLFFWLVQAVLHAEARFRLPVVPLLAAYAGAGMLALAAPRALLHESTGRKAALAAGLLAVLAAYGVTTWMFLSGRL